MDNSPISSAPTQFLSSRFLPSVIVRWASYGLFPVVAMAAPSAMLAAENSAVELPCVLLEETFDDGVADGWETVSQTFDIEGPAFRSFAINSLARTVVGDSQWTDYGLGARIMVEGFNPSKPFRGVGLLSMYQDRNNHYIFCFERPPGETGDAMELRMKRKWENPETGKIEITVLARTPFDFQTGQWYHLDARVVDGQLDFFVDGERTLNCRNTDLTRGQSGLLSVYADSKFDQVTVRSTRQQARTVVRNLEAPPVPYDGALIHFDDFENADDDTFRLVNGGWKVGLDSADNHALLSNVHLNLSRVLIHADPIADCKVETRVRVISWDLDNFGFKRFGFLTRFQDASNYYEFVYDDHRKELQIRKSINGKSITVGSAPYNLPPQQWVQLSAIMEGSTLEFYADGARQLTVSDDTFSRGSLGLISVFGDTRFDDFKIYQRDGTFSGKSATSAEDFNGFAPGDVFREYRWAGPYHHHDNIQNANRPDNKLGYAQDFMIPIYDDSGSGKVIGYRNPINKIQIDDLKNAIRAEVVLEAWGGHSGTTGKKMRINGNEWIPVETPDSVGGKYFPKEAFDHFFYPAIEVPLDQLRPGSNEFQFESGTQSVLRFGWGQWGVVGAVFRIYYDASQIHSTGTVVIGESDSADGENLTLTLEPGERASEIARVDFIGHYEDYDFDGDGIYREWHYHYTKSEIDGHAGSASEAPFTVQWNTHWIPDQDRPIRFLARVTNTDGVTWITPVSEPYKLQRSNFSVKLYKPFESPAGWRGRGNALHSNKIMISDDLSNATEALLLVKYYNGLDGGEIGVNGTPLNHKFRQVSAYATDQWPFPPSYLAQGLNKPYTLARSADHGMALMWPGIGIKVRFELEE